MVRLLLSSIVGLGITLGACRPRPQPESQVLRVAVPREPTTWNSLLASELVTYVVARQLHAPLIRLNPETQQMESALAASWAFSEEDTVLSFSLRPNVLFSDGEPFTAADVEFTFRALYDEALASPLADSARIDGEPLTAEIVDELTVSFRLPRRTGPIERIFDSIGILPRHRLADALEDGTLAEVTGVGADAEDIVGLGPFRLREHRPGQRTVLERNPHYFRKVAGERPRLAGLVFEVVPERRARSMRLLAGEVDLLDTVSPETFLELQAVDDDEVRVVDIGPGLVAERLWLNLDPDSPIEPHKKRWFRDVRFRRALSFAIDRDGLARVVFEGLASPAVGTVSPANRFWRNEELAPPAYDPDEARRLLSSAGFHLVDQALVDDRKNPVRFTLMTNAGNDVRAREAAFVQEDLARLGIELVIAEVEGSTFLARITQTHEYDAGLLGLTQTDPDPSAEMGLWTSAGPLHLWNSSQSSPATEWEARVDELMQEQLSTADPSGRKDAYDEIQRILAEELPILDLAVPHALAAHRVRVRGLRPTPFASLLWNSDELYLVE